MSRKKRDRDDLTPDPKVHPSQLFWYRDLVDLSPADWGRDDLVGQDFLDCVFTSGVQTSKVTVWTDPGNTGWASIHCEGISITGQASEAIALADDVRSNTPNSIGVLFKSLNALHKAYTGASQAVADTIAAQRAAYSSPVPAFFSVS